MKKEIKQFFSFAKNNHAILKCHINKILENIEIKQYLDQYLNEFPEWESYRFAIIGIVFNITLPKCKTCGKTLTYKNRTKTYCNKSCANKNPDIIAKANASREKTFLERFGTTNNMKNPNFIKQLKENNMKKYGVEWLTQLESTKETYRKTMQERYNVDNYFQTKECIQKIKEKHLNKTEDQLKEIYEKCKNTINKKYGVDHIFQVQHIKKEILKKRFDRQYNNFKRFKEYVIPLFSKEEYEGDIYYYKKYKWKCIKCENIFEASCFSGIIPRCLNCFPKRTSIPEKQLVNFCKQYFPNLIQNNRELIKPYELDIVIPQIKLAIQFNGIYWHSIQTGYQLGYHLMKTELSEAKGYRLIHIWEDEWNNNQNEIKNKLIDIFENKEIIDISKQLDRCWYSTLQFNNYTILPPEITIHRKFQTENCGYLIVNE